MAVVVVLAVIGGSSTKDANKSLEEYVNDSRRWEHRHNNKEITLEGTVTGVSKDRDNEDIFVLGSYQDAGFVVYFDAKDPAWEGVKVGAVIKLKGKALVTVPGMIYIFGAERL